MASDIFDVSPPAWLVDLTRSSEKGVLGKIAGELIAGAGIAAQQAGGDVEKAKATGQDLSWGRAWLQDIPKGIAEARMNLLDPMWRIKQQQQGLQVRNLQLGIQQQEQEIKNEAEDQTAIPAWLQSHSTPEARSTATDRPVPKSARWQQYMRGIESNDIAFDRAKTASTLEKSTFNGLKELSNAVDEISKYDGIKGGALSAKIAPFAAKGQMPPPEILSEVAAEREKAETKKFERQKEIFTDRGAVREVTKSFSERVKKLNEISPELAGPFAQYIGGSPDATILAKLTEAEMKAFGLQKQRMAEPLKPGETREDKIGGVKTRMTGEKLESPQAMALKARSLDLRERQLAIEDQRLINATEQMRLRSMSLTNQERRQMQVMLKANPPLLDEVNKLQSRMVEADTELKALREDKRAGKTKTGFWRRDIDTVIAEQENAYKAAKAEHDAIVESVMESLGMSKDMTPTAPAPSSTTTNRFKVNPQTGLLEPVP